MAFVWFSVGRTFGAGGGTPGAATGAEAGLFPGLQNYPVRSPALFAFHRGALKPSHSQTETTSSICLSPLEKQKICPIVTDPSKNQQGGLHHHHFGPIRYSCSEFPLVGCMFIGWNLSRTPGGGFPKSVFGIFFS